MSKVINNNIVTVGNDPRHNYNIASNIDSSSTILSAINSLTPGRTWIETVKIKGNFFVSTQIIYNGNNTKLDLTEAIFTADPTWGATALTGVAFVGMFRPGLTNTSVVRNCIIDGGKFFGSAFTTYPTFNTLQQRKVCAIHSYSTFIDSYFTNIIGNNVGSVITLEKTGGVLGTPSDNIRFDNLTSNNCWVGPQIYNNGYKTRNVYINNTNGTGVYDDFIAVIAGNGAMPSSTGGAYNLSNLADGIIENLFITNTNGAKNGATGGGIKIDAGEIKNSAGGAIIDKGIFQNVNVNGVRLSTNGLAEWGFYLAQNQNTLSRQIIGSNFHFSGSWDRSILLQTQGRFNLFTNIYGEALDNIVIQNTAIPNELQAIRFTNANFRNRNGGVTPEGNGMIMSGGSITQGIQNLSLDKVNFYYKTNPINETTPGVLGTIGIYDKVNYDIDIHTTDITALLLNSTNRTLVYRQDTIPGINNNVEQKLSTVNISGIATGTTTLLTIQTLTSVIITKAIIRNALTTGTVTTAPSLSIGSNATTFDDFMPTTALPITQGNYLPFSPNGATQKTYPAGAIITAQIDTAQTGSATVLTYTVDLWGYNI